MKLEFSAGGVVLKRTEKGVVVLLCLQKKLSGKKVYCLPKGHLEEGETSEQAALREVFEETGVEAELLQPLSPVTFFFYQSRQKIKKVVYFFLMKYISQDFKPNLETEELMWCEMQEALIVNPYKSEQEVIIQAFDSMEKHALI